MQWAATWLFKATKNQTYLHYIEEESISAVVSEFNWDLKFVGTQILLTQVSENYKEIATLDFVALKVL